LLKYKNQGLPVNDTSTANPRQYAGPAILDRGFRPFFLVASLWAALVVVIWMAMIAGGTTLPSALAPVDWHAHEMLFGYAAAAIAGFLLTAIPNWTGRLPVRGVRLALLVGLWAVGRLAVAFSASVGVETAAAIDSAFLLVLWATILREILAGRNWRNLIVAGLVGLLVVSNSLIHLEYLGLTETGALGFRLAITDMLLLIALIGGRIVPSFTRNWLAKRGETSLPSPFGRLDRLTLAVSVAAGLLWAFLPEGLSTGIAALAAALANGLRLARWRGHKTGTEPLVWILHLGYGWIAAAFALLATSLLTAAVPQTAAIHAFTTGAVGTMTLAVMTRATLGHTGRELTAGPGTTAIYLLALASGVLRVVSPLSAELESVLVALSGICWIAAFGCFVGLYGPLLAGWPRRPERR
jgi:uncharacterized protein involved in response to NO